MRFFGTKHTRPRKAPGRVSDAHTISALYLPDRRRQRADRNRAERR
jgi:hypothetical protein